MPPLPWHEKMGATLGGLLSNHRGELFQKVGAVYHARRPGWQVNVTPGYSTRPGYKPVSYTHLTLPTKA